MKDIPRKRAIASCTVLVMSLAAAAACDSGSERHPLSARPYDAARQVALNAPTGGTKADPEKAVEVRAKGKDGRITDVSAVDAAGRYLAGELAADGSRWRSTGPLAAGTRYTVKIATEDKDGAPGARVQAFETAPAKNTLKIELGPKAGTYGVGQPITAEFSEPVRTKEARAAVERALTVRSTPSVSGAWHWVDDKKAHYRPEEYWPAGATVQVRSNLEGVRVGDKLYGGSATSLKLSIGDRIEAITDASTHQMTVLRNGEVINTIPVTTGKPGFSTRNGVKVVLGKEYFVRMRGTSIGIPEGSSESYDLPVYYATRVTWSGEYVHAAPWSAGSQGWANVSHGCTGMSTGNAAWFFNTVREGDIVKVVNSLGSTMDPFGNGFGDWNLDWDEWRDGSALLDGTREGGSPAEPARLQPQV
ncbi:Ig-like domain-containing protein [Streptomyces sp. NPDC001970]